jgi:hypothetical protein
MTKKTKQKGEAPLVDGIQVVSKPRLAVVKTNLTTVLLLLAGTALLAVSIAFVLTYDTQSSNTVVTEEMLTHIASTTAAKHENEVSFERWNFHAVLPHGWVELTESVPLPLEVTEPKRTYVLPGTSCAITYAEFPALADNADYPRTSPNADIIQNDRFVGRVERRIAPTHASSTHNVATTSAPYLSHEIALVYHPLYYDNGTGDITRNAWILFSQDDTPVASACHDDFLKLVGSIGPHYEHHLLTKKDAGLFYIEQHDVLGATLLFRDTTTETAYVAAILDTGTIYRPTFSDDVFYFVAQNGTLGTHTLFPDTATSSTHLYLANGASVHDFLLTPGNIYYLAGTWCNQRMAECDLTLSRFDRTLDTSTTLAEHVPARSILGQDKDGVLYLAYREDDVGNTSGTVHTYDPTSATLTELYRYNVDTENTPAYTVHHETLADITSRFVTSAHKVASLRLADGVLATGPTTFEGVVTTRIPIRIAK